jgi:hypothetical protein
VPVEGVLVGPAMHDELHDRARHVSFVHILSFLNLV